MQFPCDCVPPISTPRRRTTMEKKKMKKMALGGGLLIGARNCNAIAAPDAPCPGGLRPPAPTALNDGQWHSVLVSHFGANGSTTVFVDGAAVFQVRERIAPSSFALQVSLDTAGHAVSAAPGNASSVDFKDMLVYRSGLNRDEVGFLETNRTAVLQASLEVFAPLASGALDNLAQSMSAVTSRSR